MEQTVIMFKIGHYGQTFLCQIEGTSAKFIATFLSKKCWDIYVQGVSTSFRWEV